jgi:hypothetical protein
MAVADSLQEPMSLPSEARRRSTLGKAGILCLVLGLVLLALLNLLTLVSEAVHDYAFNAIKGTLIGTLAAATADRMLQHSPSVIRKRDVEVATKKLSHERNVLSAANVALEKKHASLAASTKNLVVESNKLAAVTTTLAKQHSSLETSYKDLDRRHSDLTRVAQNNANIVRKTTKRLAVRSASNAARNSTSAAAEAIPYVGIAIILGVTAWDLHDACETLKDANELNAAFGQAREDQETVCGITVPTKKEIIAKASENWRVVYASAAESLNSAGKAIVDVRPPTPSWPDIRGMLCPVIGQVRLICP